MGITKKTFITLPLLCTWLFAGYYETRWVEDNFIHFFIKKSPTFQIGFINVYATDHEDNWNGQLEKKEREYAIDFCKYYLGFETEMRTMKDFEDCRDIYYQKRAKKKQQSQKKDSFVSPALGETPDVR